MPPWRCAIRRDEDPCFNLGRPARVSRCRYSPGAAKATSRPVSTAHCALCLIVVIPEDGDEIFERK